MALAKGARMHGANIVQGVAVEAIEMKRGRSASSRATITGLKTSAGTIKCNNVVNAAGLWASKSTYWGSP